ncbi:methyltransferase family protein [Brevibacterium sanguinis]|uniref:Methyltransferase family protein n=2 Tax=Brevibacterium TaxID=1696 RepID=A0A366IIN5_9MICO|nr:MULTISPECIES: class I SAM-dependent methyltransferase [Brevibacterium]RBP64665.1 methyltransferase family protein [Brevibacterium sanguinis]RBP71692.1 methyltransferase family protein [Brevibacterium celere]
MTDDTAPAHRSATRASYDAIAAEYTAWIANELAAKPYDRALLGAFSELVLAAGGGPTLEIGCGPGRVTAFLAALGLDAGGLDLSPSMIELARRHHPGIDFTVGSMTSLRCADSSLAGVVSWYSIIHVPDEELDEVFSEVARVLRPGGWFQLAFQLPSIPAAASELEGPGSLAAGRQVEHFSELAGIPVDLDFHRRSLDEVASRLAAHGFTASARVEREPDGHGQYPESTRQGYLLVRGPRLGEEERP